MSKDKLIAFHLHDEEPGLNNFTYECTTYNIEEDDYILPLNIVLKNFFEIDVLNKEYIDEYENFKYTFLK